MGDGSEGRSWAVHSACQRHGLAVLSPSRYESICSSCRDMGGVVRQIVRRAVEEKMLECDGEGPLRPRPDVLQVALPAPFGSRAASARHVSAVEYGVDIRGKVKGVQGGHEVLESSGTGHAVKISPGGHVTY